MKAEELRIGNLLNEITAREGNERVLVVCEADSITKQLINESSSCRYEPIPLTEEWLKKFGFEIAHEGEDSIAWEKKGFQFIVSQADEGKDLWPFRYQYGTGIEYVHELQNIFFALEKEELTMIP